MKTRLDGRRILITGAGSGIGAAIAELFAEEGAELALLDKDEESIAVKAKALSAHAICADVTDVGRMRSTAPSTAGRSRWTGQRRRHFSGGPFTAPSSAIGRNHPRQPDRTLDRLPAVLRNLRAASQADRQHATGFPAARSELFPSTSPPRAAFWR
jgi:NAD(P)-dependent dehydrogenase (short-subunit alcohol dehydrogenase family)